MSIIIIKNDSKNYITERYIDRSSEISQAPTSEHNPEDTLIAIDDAKIFILIKGCNCFRSCENNS